MELDQLELKLALIEEAGIAHHGLTCYSTMPAPDFGFSVHSCSKETMNEMGVVMV